MNDDPNYRRLIDELLPILKCPACGANDFELQAGALNYASGFDLYSEYLRCVECDQDFPITDDYIPIMWTPALKRILTGETSGSNLGANISIYEEVSDDYRKHTRNYPGIAKRMRNAVKRLLGEDESSLKYHLDYGCGPGHVLGWLRGYGLNQVGLDVSLANLRNARKNTGSLVVCGDAAKMPFNDDFFDIVTESSVLHHIEDWKSAVAESCRVCKSGGGVILDSEPSRDQKAYGWLARIVYNARFPVYKLLSYFQPRKYSFRSFRKALLNQKAEIHAQPGTGFPLDELRRIFEDHDFKVDIINWADVNLKCTPRPGRKSMILSLLSFRNPYNPRYGPFTAVGERK